MSNAGAMASLLLVAAALLVAVLMVAGLTYAARRRWRQSAMTMVVLAVVVTAYGVSLVVASASAPARDLAIGEWKCFDEWCASLTSVIRSGSAVEVVLSVQNRGRREQAPDTPRVWLLHDGRRDQLDLPDLASRIPGGSTRQLPGIRVVAPATDRPRLLVTEGGLPSVLVIGDDNSPFHPQSAWPLS
jgi:hypothetical protein